MSKAYWISIQKTDDPVERYNGSPGVLNLNARKVLNAKITKIAYLSIKLSSLIVSIIQDPPELIRREPGEVSGRAKKLEKLRVDHLTFS